MSSTAWAPSWTISASDFTKVNGLRRKTYGTGSYALSNMTHENTFPTLDHRFVELTLPYAVVATGVEAVRRPMGYCLQQLSRVDAFPLMVGRHSRGTPRIAPGLK